VSAIVHRGRTAEVDLPLLSAVLQSNDAHLERLVERIGRRGATRVGILGLAFKAGTDDLRASTALRIAARLVDRGVQVRWFDPLVDPDRVIGANRAEADKTLPGWEQLRCVDPVALVAGSDAVVVGHRGRGLQRAITAAATAGVLVDPIAEVAPAE
jgi:GDP-mannose 6-dehydrogenase